MEEVLNDDEGYSESDLCAVVVKEEQIAGACRGPLEHAANRRCYRTAYTTLLK